MVDITNGTHSMTVTKGAFEGIYKHQGYTLVRDYSSSIQVNTGDTSKSDNDIPIIETEEDTSDNLEETGESEEPEKKLEKVEFLETPISQWSKDQLKEFAEANNISLDGATSVKEVRGIIKAYIDSVE